MGFYREVISLNFFNRFSSYFRTCLLKTIHVYLKGRRGGGEESSDYGERRETTAALFLSLRSPHPLEEVYVIAMKPSFSLSPVSLPVADREKGSRDEVKTVA